MNDRRGFTLIELLVVIGMILVLMGAMTVSVQKAQMRARISKATQESKEMTNAILAFENMAEGRSLQKYVTGGWSECSESSMRFILGAEKGDNGEMAPVLFNASVSGGKIRDPWGKAYQYKIELTGNMQTPAPKLYTAPCLPNIYRLSDGERGL